MERQGDRPIIDGRLGTIAWNMFVVAPLHGGFEDPAVLIVVFLVVLLSAYLLGSIPTGYCVAKSRGIDIRSVGSGNIGATNAFRILGKAAGSLVLIVDAAKGTAACLLLPWLARMSGTLPADTPASTQEWLTMVAGVGAVLGHNYTCWLGFKGGKGIATSAGVLGALAPIPLAWIFTLFILVVAVTRYVSLGAIIAALALPISVAMTGGSRRLLGVSVGLAALAIYKHRANISRLMAGTENRIGTSRKGSAP